jgi:catechol 2,3-dioxygenase-like lactoylglutathione lyase family enzyme
MSEQETLEVRFEVGEAVHSGPARRMEIVHQAMDRLLPHEVLHAHRLRVTRADGELIYPDMFIGEIADQYGDAHFVVEAVPLREEAGEWTNYGFDHLALATTDRATAREFFGAGLKMKVVRDDEHLTVATTGNTAVFLFDAKPGAPLSDGLPSRIHHMGFVVDNLEAAYGHLRRTFPGFLSDFTLLERAERLSLYGHVMFGDVRFMIQLSEVKPEYRGFRDGTAFAEHMYDYAARDYGVRLG